MQFPKPGTSRRSLRALTILGLVYLATGIALLPIPVFGLLHAESSAVVATVAFFATGVAAVSCFRAGATIQELVPTCLMLAVVPLLPLTVSVIWQPNCAYWQGLLLYVVFVIPSVVLSLPVAQLFSLTVRYPRTTFGFTGLVLLIVSVVVDLGFHPQFYTFNHVFGAVLGPIYDEELSIRPALFVFRISTLLWAGLVASVSRDLVDGARRGMVRTIAQAAFGALLIAATLFPSRFGIATSYGSIEQSLSEQQGSANFVTHFSIDEFTDDELAYTIALQEYRYDQLRLALNISVQERIHVYLYPDEETKGRLTGSRRTSVTPVWLSRPQIHMLADQHESSFSHELVHVFGREFGVPILRANLSIGLVEGMAGALEAPNGLPSADLQVAAVYRNLPGADRALAEAALQTMNPVGFWSGRGAVSYTVANSFTKYLLGELGVEQFKERYGTWRVSIGRDNDLVQFASAWSADLLDRVRPDSVSEALAIARFSEPSLFERVCPHYISPNERIFRKVVMVLADGDTLRAKSLLATSEDESLALDYLSARVALSENNPGKAFDLVDDGEQVAMKVLAADAAQILAPTSASQYDEVLRTLPAYARASRASVIVRKIGVQDSSDISLLYRGAGPACDNPSGTLSPWACGTYGMNDSQYDLAARAFGLLTIPADFDDALADELIAFVRQREGDALLLAGEPDRAAIAYRESLATNFSNSSPGLDDLLRDRINFAEQFRP